MPDFFESKEELKIFLESIPPVIFIRKAEAGFPVEFSSANISCFGYEPSDFKAGKILYADIVHPEDLEAFNFGVISNSERGITDYTLEYRILTKSGDVRRVEDRTLIQYGKNSRISRYFGIVSDITTCRELAEKLGQEEQKFSSLLNSSGDILIILDRNGKFLETNEGACMSLGYDREELLKLAPANIDTRYGNQFPRQVKKISQKGKITFETTYLKKDGNSIPVEVEAHLMDYEGKSTVLTVARDISKQKKIKKDLYYSLKVNKVLELIVSNSPVVVFLSSPREKRPVEFMTENIILFGYPAGAFTSGKLTYEDIIHPLDVEKVRENLFRNYNEGRKDFFQEYRILTASGEVRWVNEQTFIHSDEKGDIEYLYGTVIDVTEKRQSSDFLRLRRDIGTALTSTDELQEILRRLLDLALEVEPLDSGCIYLTDENSWELKLKTCKGLSPAFVKAASGFGKAKGLTNLLRIGKPVYRHYFEIKNMASLEAPPEEKLRAAAFIPVFSGSRLAAVMQLSSHKADEIPEISRRQLETIALELGNEIGRIKEKAELQQTSSDFQGLFKSIKDFIFIVDHEGCIVHSNPAFRKHLSYTEKELLGKNILSFHPQNQVLKAAKNFSEILEGKTSLYSVPFVARGGGEIFAETRFSRGSWRGQEVLIALARPRLAEYETKGTEQAKVTKETINSSGV
ncbi:PAS domain S-box protein [Methanosarcina sp. WH1]|uniref:PAS domain S-box protein n=1 Tax=Methanosarcina sp. WH1 TaxID=1434102 RepID=UPI002101867F|nr:MULTISPECIES: PAS domain S-box protein [unclassified Methanosarcina]